jgi:hypothetical protein
LRNNKPLDKTPATMKISKSDALSVAFYRPELRFEQQDLTSFSGEHRNVWGKLITESTETAKVRDFI